MTYDEDELTPQERDAFASLRREIPVSHDLEERVAGALRQKGYFTRLGRAPWRVAALRIAAAILLFAAGAATERYILGSRSELPAGTDAPAAVADEPAARTSEVEMWL
ncbi:MAG TPA: hypothetical protein VFZ56_11490 [Gemmatimonadaceae bacterium]